MKKYDKSAVMTRAWKVLRRYPNLSWRTCMLYSWDVEKKQANDITPAIMRKILMGLKSFSQSVKGKPAERKHLMAKTQEHFKLLNSKTGRKIMKRSAEDDAKELLEKGELFLFDILHQRRKESKRFADNPKKIKKTFRNRIINKEHCVPINIEDYVNGNS